MSSVRLGVPLCLSLQGRKDLGFAGSGVLELAR